MTENIVVVNTCDAYEDIWELFFCAFKEYWPDCKFDIVLNTENKQKTFNGLEVKVHNFCYQDGKDKWGLRLKQTLLACDSKYVTMLYDDFILENHVDQEKIDKCIKWLNNNSDVAVFYFSNISANININDNRFDNFELMPKRGDYKLNSAPAIWRRDRLLEYIGDDDNPWAWEYFGSYRTYRNSDLFYCVKIGHEDIYPYNYNMGGAIYRGKWVGKVVVPLIEKYKLNIDISLRGLADDFRQMNKRTLSWKVLFFLAGFRMIGFGVLLYACRILRKKLLSA